MFEITTNQRKDFLHKLSTQLIRENQSIVIEDLKVRNMLKNHKLAKAISEVITLGVGLHKGYGPAQRIYVKRGYIPDGTGVWYQNKNIDNNEPCFNDDDLALYLSKKLN